MPTATTGFGITIIAATDFYIAKRELATAPLNLPGPVHLGARQLLS